jgi:hypothetical protein
MSESGGAGFPQSDPMDVYSRPVSVTETRLGTLLELPVRRDPAKPGRSLAVTWDERCPLVAPFSCSYSYVMRFDSAGSVAGNHYHKVKQEIFYPVSGSFLVGLLDLASGESERLELSAGDPRFLFVPAPVAHAVSARQPGSCLLVTADHPNTAADEFPAQVLLGPAGS